MKRLVDAVNDALHRVGLHLGRWPASTHALSRRRRLLAHAAIDLVLDVGANVGQYVHELRRQQQYRGRVISFEPLPSAYARLAQAARSDPLWEVHPLGLAATAGRATLQVAANSCSSSILDMLPAHLAAAPDSHPLGRVDIEVRTLDALFPGLSGGARHVWLKIDTQGYEHEVLEGARQSLQHIDVVQLEMSLAALYAGAPEIHQTLARMAEAGFRLIGLEPGFEEAASGVLLQADGIFSRRAWP